MAQLSSSDRVDTPRAPDGGVVKPPVLLIRTFFRIARAVLSILMVVGAAVAIYGARLGMESKFSENWPSVSGVIVASRVEKPRGAEAGGLQAKIVYEYSVAGKKYQGDRVSFNQGSGFAPDDPRKLTARYPRNASVKVHYDPGAPQKSVLEPGFMPTSLIPVGIGVFLLGIGLAGTRNIRAKEKIFEQEEEPSAPEKPAEPPQPQPVPSSPSAGQKRSRGRIPVKKPGGVPASRQPSQPEPPPPPLPGTTESPFHKLLRYALLAWLVLMLCLALLRWDWFKA